MGRELPRTLRTLGPGYQRGIAVRRLRGHRGRQRLRRRRLDAGLLGTFAWPRSVRSASTTAPPSPARAANLGVDAGRRRPGRADRRRRPDGLAGPAGHGAGRGPAAPIGRWSPPWVAPGPGPAHGGGGRRLRPGGRGRAAGRDRLAGGRLPAVRGRHAGLARRPGLVLGPLAESSALFLPRGAVGRAGRARRARSRCPAAGWSTTTSTGGPASWTASQLVTLLGEGTFHQFHGGAATSGVDDFEELQRRVRPASGERVPAPHRPRRSTSGTCDAPRWPTSTSQPGWRRAPVRRGRPTASPVEVASAHALEVAVGVEAEPVALTDRVGHPVVVVAEDLLDRLGGTRARSWATPGARPRWCPP